MVRKYDGKSKRDGIRNKEARENGITRGKEINIK